MITENDTNKEKSFEIGKFFHYLLLTVARIRAAKSNQYKHNKTHHTKCDTELLTTFCSTCYSPNKLRQKVSIGGQSPLRNVNDDTHHCTSVLLIIFHTIPLCFH